MSGGILWTLQCAITMAALTLSCGARTPLRGADPCAEAGATRTCQAFCGQGISTCVEGFWSTCIIPPTTEACEDICGTGTRTCQNETWSECFVPIAEESCENNCGTGTRTCVQSTWSECRVPTVVEECTHGCGPGSRTCKDDEWSVCDAPKPLPPILNATVRDFTDSHPDFERDLDGSGPDPQIVEEWLGPDDKPVYRGGDLGTTTTTGAAYFDWYTNDSASTQIEIPLQVASHNDEFYVYENRAFFPIDGQLYGNQGRDHNYHFTLELAASFTYQRGQEFYFDGDDDIWVFINRRLAIDLGGLHESMAAGVVLDEAAAYLNIVEGQEYPLHIFFAERHTVDSNFVIETSIANLGKCPESEP